MAIDHIAIDVSSRGGQMLLTLVDMFRQFLDQMKRCRTVGTHCQDGATYTAFEQYFGIPAGTGADIWFALDSLNSDFSTDAAITGLQSLAQNFIGRLG